MKLARAVLLLSTATRLSAADLSGSWKLYSTWPDGPGAKMLGDIVLDLKVDGDKVTGVTHLASWPGDAPVANGKIDNGRITFTATGRLTSSTGIPTCRFEVTVNGEEMTAAMTAISNSFIGDERLIFKGRRIER